MILNNFMTFYQYKQKEANTNTKNLLLFIFYLSYMKFSYVITDFANAYKGTRSHEKLTSYICPFISCAFGILYLT